MDQDTMVRVNLLGGWRLIGALVGRGFAVDAALWARLSGEERWVLYLESPDVGNRGLGECYRTIHAILHDAPEWGLDPFTVTVLGAGNPMARAAAALATHNPLTVRNPSLKEVVRFSGGTLGGFPVEAAFIYPPWEAGINLVA